MLIQRLLRSKLANESARYMLWQMLAAALPFLALPVITRMLSPAEYGHYGLFTAAFMVVGPLVSPGFLSKIQRDFAGQSLAKTAILVGNVVVLAALLALVLSGLLWGFSGLVGRVSLVEPTMQLLWPWMALLMLITSLSFTLAELVHKPHIYGFFRIGHAALMYILGVVFIFLGMGWHGLVFGQIIALAVCAVVTFIWLKKNSFFSYAPSRAVMKKALIFGVPLVPYGMSLSLMALADRALINKYWGAAQVGPYLVAYQVSAVMFLLVAALVQAFKPWMNERLHQHSATLRHEVYRGFVYASLAMLGFGGAVCCAAYVALPLLLGANCIDSATYVPWLSLAWAFYGVCELALMVLMFAGKVKIIGAAAIVLVGVCVVLNVILVPVWGALGAAVAVFVAYGLGACVLSVVAYLLLKKGVVA